MASHSKRRRVDFDDLVGDRSIEINLGSTLNAYLLPPAPPRVTDIGLSRIPDTVKALRIVNCNAAFGVPFSSASCHIESNAERVLFGDIFEFGLILIVNFLKNSELPSTNPEKFILWKLLRFVKDEQKTFENIGDLTETDLVTLLANHLFGRLSTSDDFIIDKTCHGKGRGSKKKCHCGKEDCNLTGSYGDTSIGNSQVWHGSVDIIIGNDICVEPIVENPDGSPGGKSPVEVKKKKASSISNLGQIFAETIVFSFLQKKRHPENNHFLTPCIGVGGNEMVIMFYDAVHDILLESSPIPLMESVRNGISKFTIHAILVSWLVVNYKFLCSGLTERMKSLPKANFFEQAKMKIEVYENDVQFQNVGRSISSRNATPENLNVWDSPLLTKLYSDVTGVLCKPKE